MRLPYATNPLGRYDHNADEIKAFFGLLILSLGIFMLFGAAIFHSILPLNEVTNDMGTLILRPFGFPILIVSYILGGAFTLWGAILVILRLNESVHDFVWLFESNKKEEDESDS